MAYVWSQELQDVADDLPANQGRSSMVHGLMQVLDLLQEQRADEIPRSAARDAAEAKDGDSDNESVGDDAGDSSNRPEIILPRMTGKATIVPPKLEFGSPSELKRYHDAKYVGTRPCQSRQ